MPASHDHGESHKEGGFKHSFDSGSYSRKQSRRRCSLDCHHHNTPEINTDQRQQLGHEMQNIHVATDAARQPQFGWDETGQLQLRSVRRAQRTSQVVNGVLNTEAAVSLTSGTISSRDKIVDAQDDDNRSRAPNSAKSGFTGPSPPVLSLRPSQPTRHIAELDEFEGRVGKTPQSTSYHIQLNKDPQNASTIPDVQPPDAETWGPPNDPLKPRPWHDELHFGNDSQHYLLPQKVEATQSTIFESRARQPRSHESASRGEPVYELAGSIPQPTVHQPTPTDLTLFSSRSHLIQYGTAAQLKVLDAWQHAENAPKLPEKTANFQNGLHELQETSVKAFLPPITVEQQHSDTPLYGIYTAMRNWEFEDVTETYKKTLKELGESSSPSAKHNGGSNWFYGKSDA